MLISISGFYGSGGNELGFALGQKLNYPVYDGELMAKAVEASGIDMRRSTLAFYDETDENIDKNFSTPFSSALLKLQLDVLPIGRNENAVQTVENRDSGLLSRFLDTVPTNVREGSPIRQKNEIEHLKQMQTKVILEAAEIGDGIFLGRCSSQILRGRPDTLRIFATASIASCRERIANKFSITNDAKLEKFIKRTNRRRAYFFETFTGLMWDDSENYDLCINTDYLGFDGSMALIENVLKLKQGK